MGHPHVATVIRKVVVVLPARYPTGIGPTGWFGAVRLQISGWCVAKLVLGGSDAGWDRTLYRSVRDTDQIGSQCKPHHHLGGAAPGVLRDRAEASATVCFVFGCEGEEPCTRGRDAMDPLALQVVCVIADLLLLRVIQGIVFVAWDGPPVGAIRELSVGCVDLPAVPSPKPRPDAVCVAVVAAELALGPAMPVRVAGEAVDASLETEIPMLDEVAVIFVLVSTGKGNDMLPVSVRGATCNLQHHHARQANGCSDRGMRRSCTEAVHARCST